MDQGTIVLVLVLGGVGAISYGIVLPSADRDTWLMKIYRQSLTGSSLWPRGWPYGAVPFGLALITAGVSIATAGTVRVAAYLVACTLGYVTLWMSAHPPDALKPRSIRDLEARGERLPPLDAWGRFTYILWAGFVTLAIVMVPLLRASPS